MKTWKRNGWMAVVLLAGMVVAGAGPLQRADVIADPVWVIHVDFDGLRQTSVGKALLAELDKPEAQKKFAAMQAVFNVDPRKDLHGATLYGTTKSESDVVVIAYADFDAARLVTLVEANKDYQSTTHGSHTVHSWIDEKKKEKNGVKPRTYGAIYKGKVLVIGQRENRVMEALDVMDHSKPNLTTSTQYSQLGGSGGGFIIGAARKLDLPGNDPGAQVLKQSRMFWLNVREAQGRAEAKLDFEADNAEVAQQMGDVCRGLMAVLSLQTDKPDAVKLAKAMNVSQSEKVVSVKLSLPADDVVEIIKAKSAKKSSSE